MTRSIIHVSCLAIAALFPGAAPAQADCTDLFTRLDGAITGGQLPQAKALEAQIGRDAVCGGRLKEAQRRRAAFQLILVARLRDRDPASPEAEQLLADADQPDVLWQAAKAVGDLRFSQRRFADATIAFERALEIIRNRGNTPQAPDAAMIRQIFESATSSRLLAANEEDKARPPIYVATAKDDRDGSPGGSFSPDIRGFRPESVPLAIRFETAAAVLSPVGLQAARELLEALQHQKPAQVIIVGHTDERGGEAYNLRLADERAKSVKKFLEQNGIQGVKTIAKGKGEPLKLQNAQTMAGMSREETWALNRRVEWRRE